MDKSKISFRIGRPQWYSKEGLEQLYALCVKYARTIDELAFFDSETHCPMPLDFTIQSMDKLKRIMPRFRDLGMTTGINILSTTGHHDENLSNSLQMHAQKLVGPDGMECKGCYCVLDQGVQQYIKELYELVAMAKPDFIWMDDDIRAWGHMPILCSCFCEKCIAMFSSETGEIFTRKSLMGAFVDESLSRKLDIRKKWLEHNRNILNKTVSAAESAVHNINDKIVMGLMSGEKFFEGYDFKRLMDTLQGPNAMPVMSRPGGGFWDDTTPLDMAKKAHAVGRQVAMLPDYVTDIQSESESFPHQKLVKSVHITTVEAAVHLSAGSTGTAFNILSWAEGSLDEYLPFLDNIKSARPFYDRVVSTFQRSVCEGLWFAWNENTFVVNRLNKSSWLAGDGKFHDPDKNSQGVYEIGIPPAYRGDGARVTVLAGDSPLIFEKEEIKQMLAGCVMIDGPALKHLSDMGLAECTGFKIVNQRDDDTIEVLTEHELNGVFAGAKRDCRQSFKWWWGETAYAIKPISDNTQILARMIDYSGNQCGVSMGIFENSLGGRVAVTGYFPWKLIYNNSKSSQIKSITRWLSRDTMPAYVKSFEKVNLWTRRTTDGGYGALLLNSGFDHIDRLEILLLTEKDTISVFYMDCKHETVECCGSSDHYKRFLIPNLKPWTAVFVKS